MKKIIFILLTFLTFIQASAQILEPVKWTHKVKQKSTTNYVLVFDATIEKEWHVYSQFTDDGGSLPLVLKFKNQNGNYDLVGKTKEIGTKTVFNDIFNVNETFFENKIHFEQEIKIGNPNLKSVEVIIDYQACKMSCINLIEKIQFEIPKTEAVAVAPTEIDTVKIDTATKAVAEIKAAAPKTQQTSEPVETPKGLWSIFLGTLLAGLFATITPCVFPMIPMTVSYFLKHSVNKSKGKANAFFYGFCIIGIYVLISIPFHLFESLNPDIFSEISTNVYLNIFFFLVFVVFAASFFGAFEITIPTSLVNKADNASNSGGLLGIFFMALTLIIVSFSCTGPALGFVLGSVLSTDGGATILTIAMFGFGLGLALPFISFALFPSLMHNLPKSGGWLNTVKVIFGFIELALAFKFLSNADLVLQGHWLEREVFVAIWIAIFGLMGLYLFGKIKLPHDSPMGHLSVGRMLFGLVTLAFTVYLIPGLWGAPLKLISAFTPPQEYSESPHGFGGSLKLSENTAETPAGAKNGPHNIAAFEDYYEGLAYAKKVNKPILIDFTGRACQNCRLMENNVWSDPAILKILKNDIVLISLYGDERTELPKNEHYVSKITGSEITTVGQKWSEFQRIKYKSNARPFYVLMSLDETNLNPPVGYTPNIKEYESWLKAGIANFKK